MTRRTRLTLLYAGTGSSRWVRTAASSPDGDLLAQCVWQWKNARATAAAERPALRVPQFPEFPPADDFLSSTRKPRGK